MIYFLSIAPFVFSPKGYYPLSLASTYAVYLFHVPVLVPLQYALRYAAFGPLMKFPLVTLIAIPTTFAICDALSVLRWYMVQYPAMS